MLNVKGILSLKIKLILNENWGENMKIVSYHFRKKSPNTEKNKKSTQKWGRAKTMEDKDVLSLFFLFSQWRDPFHENVIIQS